MIHILIIHLKNQKSQKKKVLKVIRYLFAHTKKQKKVIKTTIASLKSFLSAVSQGNSKMISSKIQLMILISLKIRNK